MDPIDPIGSVNSSSGVSATRAVTPSGRDSVTAASPINSLPSDSFHPSDEMAEEQAETGGSAQNRENQEADAQLLNSTCGEGCSCSKCGGAGKGDDATKALEKRDQEVKDHEAAHL